MMFYSPTTSHACMLDTTRGGLCLSVSWVHEMSRGAVVLSLGINLTPIALDAMQWATHMMFSEVATKYYKETSLKMTDCSWGDKRNKQTSSD